MWHVAIPVGLEKSITEKVSLQETFVSRCPCEKLAKILLVFILILSSCWLFVA